MAQKPTEIAYPSMRSLNSVRGLRRFICRVIVETKAGLLPLETARVLVYCASRAAAIDQSAVLEARIAAVEARLAAAPAHKPNGYDHAAAAST